MKKLSTILILLCSSLAFSQIESHGTIDMGWKDGINSYYYGDNKVSYFEYPANTFYSDVNLDFSWKFIKVKQQINNSFCYKDGTSFNPIDIEFVSTLSFKFSFLFTSYN
jgi:hypothetical protein